MYVNAIIYKICRLNFNVSAANLHDPTHSVLMYVCTCYEPVQSNAPAFKCKCNQLRRSYTLFKWEWQKVKLTQPQSSYKIKTKNDTLHKQVNKWQPPPSSNSHRTEPLVNSLRSHQFSSLFQSLPWLAELCNW